MDAGDVLLLLLRIFHAFAAAVWLGGGIYYLVAIRPQLGSSPPEYVLASRRAFGEWARSATAVLLASGTVLMFDGLSSGRGGLLYAGLLAAKVVAALAAFWIVMRRRRGAGRSGYWAHLPLALGAAAFVIGVVLSSVWEAA